MSIDITQQALNALADAGLGSDSPAEAYVIGYTQGHDDALALAICRSCPVIGECRRPPTSTTGSTATSCRASGAAADTGSNDDPRKDQQ